MLYKWRGYFDFRRTYGGSYSSGNGKAVCCFEKHEKITGNRSSSLTHKLNEVMAISDRVAILRKGEYIGVVETSETDPDQLTEMMVGRPISLEIERPEVNGAENVFG